jgi:hypothetical protein
MVHICSISPYLPVSTILSQPKLSTPSLIGTNTARTRNQRSVIPNAHPIEFSPDQSSRIQKCKSSLSRLSFPIPKANNKRRRISGRARARAPSSARSLPTQAGEEAIVDRSVVGESVYHSEIEHAAANLGNRVMSLRGTTRDCRWDGVGGYLPLSVSLTIVWSDTLSSFLATRCNRPYHPGLSI